jgi:hypothetical protein
MQIELRIYDVGVEQRWNWLQFFEQQFLPLHARRGIGRVLGTFLSYRDDAKLVWLHGYADAGERLRNDDACKALLANAPVPIRESIVRILTPAIGSTITTLDDFTRINDPILELRQYRIAAGKRAQFATFLRDRTLAGQIRSGMNVYGPFDDLEDENNLVWFRGFPDLFERDRRKAAFYQSKLWLEELETDAFTMIEDYSNVMLLAPVPVAMQPV